MVRINLTRLQRYDSSPHARGDGPSRAATTQLAKKFSPRAWGWSAAAQPSHAFDAVLPTRVGMVRRLPATLMRRRSSPHARGDGPPSTFTPSPHAQFSPRAWGWSVARRSDETAQTVLPTRVGMVRYCRALNLVDSRFSPRAWGWSDSISAPAGAPAVLPTRVGMVLPVEPPQAGRLGSPHARGDGPTWRRCSTTSSTFSPRAWGWS